MVSGNISMIQNIFEFSRHVRKISLMKLAFGKMKFANSYTGQWRTRVGVSKSAVIEVASFIRLSENRLSGEVDGIKARRVGLVA